MKLKKKNLINIIIIILIIINLVIIKNKVYSKKVKPVVQREEIISKSNCEDGYIFKNEECLKQISLTEKVTFFNAQTKCAHWGGEMATPLTDEENQFILKTVMKNNSNYWVGISDSITRGMFHNPDHLSNKNYTNWFTPSSYKNKMKNNNKNYNRPYQRNGSEHCTRIMKDGKWKLVNCNLKKNFVCRRKYQFGVKGRNKCHPQFEYHAIGLPKPIFQIKYRKRKIMIRITLANVENVDHYLAFSPILNCNDTKPIGSNLFEGEGYQYWKISKTDTCSTTYKTVIDLRWFLNKGIEKSKIVNYINNNKNKQNRDNNNNDNNDNNDQRKAYAWGLLKKREKNSDIFKMFSRVYGGYLDSQQVPNKCKVLTFFKSIDQQMVLKERKPKTIVCKKKKQKIPKDQQKTDSNQPKPKTKEEEEEVEWYEKPENLIPLNTTEPEPIIPDDNNSTYIYKEPEIDNIINQTDPNIDTIEDPELIISNIEIYKIRQDENLRLQMTGIIKSESGNVIYDIQFYETNNKDLNLTVNYSLKNCINNNICYYIINMSSNQILDDYTAVYRLKGKAAINGNKQIFYLQFELNYDTPSSINTNTDTELDVETKLYSKDFEEMKGTFNSQEYVYVVSKIKQKVEIPNYKLVIDNAYLCCIKKTVKVSLENQTIDSDYDDDDNDGTVLYGGCSNYNSSFMDFWKPLFENSEIFNSSLNVQNIPIVFEPYSVSFKFKTKPLMGKDRICYVHVNPKFVEKNQQSSKRSIHKRGLSMDNEDEDNEDVSSISSSLIPLQFDDSFIENVNDYKIPLIIFGILTFGMIIFDCAMFLLLGLYSFVLLIIFTVIFK